MDFVWSQFVICFLPNPETAVREFARVTRPGGTVCVAIHDEPMGRLDPPDPDIEAPITQLRRAVLQGFDCRYLPMMFRRAGLTDVSVSIETDRIYSKIGAISPEQRRNVEEMFGRRLRQQADQFGGINATDNTLATLLAFLDRDDTSAITQYWVVKGRVPGRNN